MMIAVITTSGEMGGGWLDGYGYLVAGGLRLSAT